MADNRNLPDDVSISTRSEALSQSSASASSSGADTATGASGDVADDIPVPPAMSPAEIDERAQVVEALRGDQSAVADAAERATEPASARATGRSDEAVPPRDV